MKQIRIVCWFEESEVWLARLVISEGFRIIIRKIVDPLLIMSTIARGIVGEKYDIKGEEDEINRFIIWISDMDIEIIEKESP